MRYFVIEDRVDVSVYDSFEAAVLAIEPADLHRMKLFDEFGNDYPLSAGRKKNRFLGFWPCTVESTIASATSIAATREFKGCLREYVSKVKINVPPQAGLPELVEIISIHQGTP